MLIKYKKLILVGTCALLGMGVSQAAVMLSFAQVGNNVTATWSGDYDVPASSQIPTSYDNGMDFGPKIAAATAGGAYAWIENVGTTFTTSLSSRSINDGYIGTDFGFDGTYNTTYLLIPAGTSAGILSVSGTMTIPNTTLAEMGATSFNNTLAWRGTDSVNGSRDIVFSTVPEPSSTLMLGMFATAALFTRKRVVR